MYYSNNDKTDFKEETKSDKEAEMERQKERYSDTEAEKPNTLNQQEVISYTIWKSFVYV